MTDTPLTSECLKCLRVCRGIAIENLRFYEKLYDDLEDDTIERDSIGRALAQKQSFIGAADAILNNHDIDMPDVALTEQADTGSGVSDHIEAGDHLSHEERFYNALQSCIGQADDQTIIELLTHHAGAAKIAVSALKATSLII